MRSDILHRVARRRNSPRPWTTLSLLRMVSVDLVHASLACLEVDHRNRITPNNATSREPRSSVNPLLRLSHIPQIQHEMRGFLGIELVDLLP